MKYFARHLEEANETYFQHFCHAMSFAGHMLFGATACAIHALLPFLFVRTGSSQIAQLYDRMIKQRLSRHDETQSFQKS